jgi:hypothetical protein
LNILWLTFFYSEFLKISYFGASWHNYGAIRSVQHWNRIDFGKFGGATLVPNATIWILTEQFWRLMALALDGTIIVPYGTTLLHAGAILMPW